MSRPDSGFVEALSALRSAGVDFVVVGVGGINFYARTPGEAYATLDLDSLLPPLVDNLRAALRALDVLGYRFESGGEPFLEIDDETVLGRVVANGACLTALHEESGQLDLLTSIAGFSYAALSEDATPFAVAGVEVRVGSLEKLLRSKQASGRPKDLEFLRIYQAGLSEDPEAGKDGEEGGSG